MKKLLSLCLTVLILLTILPVGTFAAEIESSEYNDFISLACNVFPEFADKIRTSPASTYSRNNTLNQREQVYTETRRVDGNEYLIYTEYSDGLVLLTNYEFLYEPTYETISSSSQGKTYEVDIKATCNEWDYNGIFYLNDVRFTLDFSDYDSIDSVGSYTLSGSCSINSAGMRVKYKEDASEKAYLQYPLNFWPYDSGYFTYNSLLKIEVGDDSWVIYHYDIG